MICTSSFHPCHALIPLMTVLSLTPLGFCTPGTSFFTFDSESSLFGDVPIPQPASSSFVSTEENGQDLSHEALDNSEAELFFSLDEFLSQRQESALGIAQEKFRSLILDSLVWISHQPRASFQRIWADRLVYLLEQRNAEGITQRDQIAYELALQGRIDQLRDFLSYPRIWASNGYSKSAQAPVLARVIERTQDLSLLESFMSPPGTKKDDREWRTITVGLQVVASEWFYNGRFDLILSLVQNNSFRSETMGQLEWIASLVIRIVEQHGNDTSSFWNLLEAFLEYPDVVPSSDRRAFVTHLVGKFFLRRRFRSALPYVLKYADLKQLVID